MGVVEVDRSCGVTLDVSRKLDITRDSGHPHGVGHPHGPGVQVGDRFPQTHDGSEEEVRGGVGPQRCEGKVPGPRVDRRRRDRDRTSPETGADGRLGR